MGAWESLIRKIQEKFPEPRPSGSKPKVPQPVMAQLAEAGKLTRDDMRELEKSIKTIERQQKTERKLK